MQSRFDLACRKHALSLPLRTTNSSILLLLAFASHLITQTNKTSINARWGQTAEPHHQWRLGLLKSYTALLPQSSVAVRVQPIISSHLISSILHLPIPLAMSAATAPGDAPLDAASGQAAPPAGRPRAGSMRRPLQPLDLPIIKHLNSNRVILASASPRRKQLLQQVWHHENDTVVQG